jgi:hypothetical protein
MLHLYSQTLSGQRPSQVATWRADSIHCRCLFPIPVLNSN